MIAVLFSLLVLSPGEADAFLSGKTVLSTGTLSAPGFELRSSLHVSLNTTESRSAFSGTAIDATPQRKKTVRPLTQNWWPVSLVSTLDATRPNPIELLDRKLVLWHGGSGGWSCLDDQCAHRFAPLSEGRVVVDEASGSSCLQCAYHGWEFGSGGGCSRVPQAPGGTAGSRGCSVTSYPVRECAGMIWVWADPNVDPDEEGVDPPSSYVSDLLRRFDEAGRTAGGYQRDLPYGMEYLGENLVDVSHLPFSHHSVGTLNRADGRPVPLEMLSEAEKEKTAASEGNEGGKLPLYQVRVVDAAEHDPEIFGALKYQPQVRALADPNLASCTIGFLDPCLVRYNRETGAPDSTYEINLFMCPTTKGKSRVFLFTPFKRFLPEKDKADQGKENGEGSTPSPNTRERPSGLVMDTKAVRKLFGAFRRRKKGAAFPPHLGHLIAHSIFDGDGIFLNKQGDRMSRAGLTYRDYQTPTSSDLLVNAYCRWLSRAVSVTSGAGDERSSGALTGGTVYEAGRPRAEMLDRYATHTAHCKICQAALKEVKGRRDRLVLASKALVGAAGASGVLLACAAILATASRVILRESLARAAVFRSALTVSLSSVLAIIASCTGWKKTEEQKAALDKEIRQFYFEDYVHAEKD